MRLRAPLPMLPAILTIATAPTVSSLTQQRAPVVNGTARNVQGQVVVGADISLTGSCGQRATKTDNSGRFEFRDVSSGPCTVRAAFPRLAPRVQAVDVAEGAATTVNLILSTSPPNPAATSVADLFYLLQGVPSGSTRCAPCCSIRRGSVLAISSIRGRHA